MACSIFGLGAIATLAICYVGGMSTIPLIKLFKAGLAWVKAHDPFSKTPPATPPAG